MQYGWTALHLTSQDGHEEVVRILLKANARVNQRSKVFRYFMYEYLLTHVRTCMFRKWPVCVLVSVHIQYMFLLTVSALLCEADKPQLR